MKFSLSSFLCGVAATTLVFAAKKRNFFNTMLGYDKKQTSAGKNKILASAAEEKKRPESVISEIA